MALPKEVRDKLALLLKGYDVGSASLREILDEPEPPKPPKTLADLPPFTAVTGVSGDYITWRDDNHLKPQVLSALRLTPSKIFASTHATPESIKVKNVLGDVAAVISAAHLAATSTSTQPFKAGDSVLIHGMVYDVAPGGDGDIKIAFRRCGKQAEWTYAHPSAVTHA